MTTLSSTHSSHDAASLLAQIRHSSSSPPPTSKRRRRTQPVSAFAITDTTSIFLARQRRNTVEFRPDKFKTRDEWINKSHTVNWEKDIAKARVGLYALIKSRDMMRRDLEQL